MDYILKVTDSTTHHAVRLCVKTPQPLSPDEIKGIKANCHFIFTKFKNKPVSTINLSELNIQPVQSELVAPENVPHYRMTVRKMGEIQPSKAIYRSRLDIFRKLIKNEPHSPLKFLWSVFVAPLIALYRFHIQDRHLTQRLHHIFGSEINTQAQLISQLKRMKKRFERGVIDPKSQDQLVEFLDQTITFGKQIEQLRLSKEGNVSSVAQSIAETLSDNTAKGELLGMVPLTLSINGSPTPLLFAFRKEKEWIYLDIKGLPSSKNPGLNPTYAIPADKAKQALPSVVEALVGCHLAQGMTQSKGYLSRREKIRLENLALLGVVPAPKAGKSVASLQQNDSIKWLNEMLCNFASPVASQKETIHEKDPFLEMLHDFETYFPDASALDKIEWFLSSIDEEYTALSSVFDQLTPEDQNIFLNRLEEKIRVVQKHLNSTEARDSASLFKAFFDRLDAFKAQKVQLKDRVHLSREALLSKPVPSKNTYRTQVDLSNIQAKLAEKPSAAAQKSEISLEQLKKLEDLKAGLANESHKQVLEYLTALHKDIDLMIEKEQYLSAQELAIQVLSILPVPSHQVNSFWARVSGEMNDTLSQTLTDLVKDVWESSLRLNISYPQPYHVIQLIKAQTINMMLMRNYIPQLLNDYTLDYTEIENIVHLHPHLRFGWKPEQEQELKQIMSFVKEEKLHRHPTRLDGRIEVFGALRPFDAVVMQRQKGRPFPGMFTDFARLQVMLTSLMKPNYCLTPFFGDSKLDIVTGLAWLDGLEAQAIANGAKTREEIQEGIRLIRLREVQLRLKSFKRLELSKGNYVTQHPCVTIVDSASTSSSSALAYLPNGYGLPREYEAKYGALNNQTNTSPLAGAARGVERFIGHQDRFNYAYDGTIMSGLKNSLSPQVAQTEPTLLQANLQKPPKGQIGQVENYLLEATQIGPLSSQQLLSPTTKALNEGSILESLNILFQEHHLSEPEVQRTILLLLSRSFLLEKELQKFPQEMLAIAHQLHDLIQKKSQDPVAFPFILQVGQMIKDHAEALRNLNHKAINEIATHIPCFDNEIKIQNETKTGKEWLESILKDPDKEHVNAAIAYMYALMNRPVQDMAPDTLLMALYSASFFGEIADSVGIPQFNRIVESWVSKTFLPAVAIRFQQQNFPLDQLLNKWMELALPAEYTRSPTHWHIVKNEPLTVENDSIRITLPTLQITSKETGQPFSTQQIFIPSQVQRSATFLNFFGNAPLRANLTRDSQNPNHFIYSFAYGPMKNTYRVIYDQSNGKVEVQCQLPIDPKKKEGPKEWFVYVSGLISQGSSTIEQHISKEGVWINQKNPKNAYLFTAPLKTAKRADLYQVKLNQEGVVQEVRSVKENRPVAFLSIAETEALVPFANGSETMVLLSPKNRVQEIRFLDQKCTLTKNKDGQWIYSNPRLDKNWELALDLSARKKEALENTQEKIFIDQFGSDHYHFLVPLKGQNQERQFLINPYQIHATVKQGLRFDKESITNLANQPVITISFGKEGEIQGSLSALSYLAYYFFMKKDYERAMFYLEKAKQMPAQSENERITFERIANLFNQIPYRSFESVVFQLKAQLTLRHIMKTQFSRTIYSRENEAEFVSNVSHITQLYKQYLAESPHRIGADVENPLKLKASEEYLLQRIQWTSFEKWIEKQKEIDRETAGERPQPLKVKENTFLSTKLNVEKLRNIDEGLFPSCVLLATDLKRPFTTQQLVQNKIPSGEFLVRHFFQFYNQIAQSEDSAKEILNYLLKIPAWHMHPAQTEDDRKLNSMADEVRTILIFLCIRCIQGDSHPTVDLNNIDQTRNRLPYWGRQNIKPIRFFLSYHDLRTFKGESLKQAFIPLISTFATIADSLKEYEGQTVGEALELVPAELAKIAKSKEEDYKDGLSLQAILKHLENVPQEHFYLPIELTEIPEIIKQEKDADLNKITDIMTMIRQSESRQFPILQMRALSENMREIIRLNEKITRKAKERAKHSQDVKASPINSAGTLALQQALKEEARSFNKLSDNDIQRQRVDLENLNQKYEIAQHYFASHPALEEDPALKEEYHQLISGLEAARKTIEEEYTKKSTFSLQEIKDFQEYLEKHVLDSQNSDDALVKVYQQKRKDFLDKLKESDPQRLPKKLKEMLAKPDLYTDFDLVLAVQKLYKDPRHHEWFTTANGGELNQLMTELLLYKTAFQQFSKAYELLQTNPGKALELVRSGMELDRYFSQDGTMIDPLVSRKCLVAEARSGIIYRPGQRDIINKVAQNPQQWLSLRMGLGKTSYAMPTIAEILAEQGRAVVLTVPDKLLKSNRKDIDKATRTLFDQAGIEFSLPLTQNLPLNFLAEKVIQVEEVFKNKNYVITTVEELATLHDTCILLEDQKLKIHQKPDLTEKDALQLTEIEMRLHYYRKLDRLLNGNATELNLPSIFFGDETDDTHHISHEVSIATGDKVSPSKQVREVSRAILESVLTAPKGSALDALRDGLANNTYPAMREKEIQGYMQSVSTEFLQDRRFLSLLGEKGAALVRNLDAQQWSNYLTGQSDTLPDGLPAWDKDDEELVKAQAIIGAAKQLLTVTFPNFLAQKSGNDIGLSDFEGFIVVPKTTKNETEGMRYADEFEMIFGQYFGYLEFLACQSLTDKSVEFLEKALKTFKEKSPVAYAELLKDYHALVEKLHQNKDLHIPSLFEYVKSPEAFQHRWNILDNIVFDGGYLSRFNEQVHTNVQEIFHRKACGGVTGTLDPYSLPYISDEVQLHLTQQDKQTSTREVEAETFLRMGLNVSKGLDQPSETYADAEALKAVDTILGDPVTKAFINSTGAASEGMNTFTWIEMVRKLPNGKNRSYLFMHPTERIPYLWSDKASKPIPYKGESLPDNTICMYAPSDVRGVDLPIKKGKVHMFVSPTASLQELVQSLYRARQLGGDHELVLHIPDSLKNKISETKAVTYGDVIVYLVERSSPMKLELNLKAQLMKVQFDLKTTITRYLKETNPDYDQNNFWSKDIFKKLTIHTKAQAAIFKEVRDLYIQIKQIDFEGCYAPRTFVSGTEKVMQEFDRVKDQVAKMLPSIKKASLESFFYLVSEQEAMDGQTKLSGLEAFKYHFQKNFQELYDFVEQVQNQDASYPNLLNSLMGIGMQINVAASANNDEIVFDSLADAQALLQTQIQQLQSKAESQEEPMKTVIQHLRTCERLITETTYGKGKSHLYNTLRSLHTEMDQQKKNFESQVEAHKKYLPKQTTSNVVGNAGSNEQVKEMQQQKTQEVEKVAEDPNAIPIGTSLPARTRHELGTPAELQTKYPPHYIRFYTAPLGLTPPFDQFLISNEAKDLLSVLSMMTGHPLVYIGVDQSGPRPMISLISRNDYHERLKHSLSNPYTAESFSNYTVYEPLPTGFRWLAGGKNSDFKASIPPELMNKLMTIKAYLGYKDEFAASDAVVTTWKNSLSAQERKAILDHVDKMGSPAQRKIFQNLLG